MELDFSVSSKSGAYPVRFRTGVVSQWRRAPETVVVADRVLGVDADIEVDAGEGLKSLAKIEQLALRLHELGAQRRTRLVACGGGSVLDAAGLLGALYMRGMPVVYVPTTLLAQVDATIGGKTAVNVGAHKNLLGVVRAPTEVLIDVAVLSTQTPLQLCSGFAEALKAHALLSPAAFDEAALSLDAVLRHDAEALVGVVYRSLQQKKAVVEADEDEAGLRRILNFGHTFGHALEALFEFQVPHGLCVAQGMVYANDFAVRMGLLPPVHARRMQPALQRLTSLIDACWRGAWPSAAAVEQAMRGDKKNQAGLHHLVVLTGETATPSIVPVSFGSPELMSSIEATRPNH